MPQHAGWILLLLFSFAIEARAQVTPPPVTVALTAVERLKCTFTLMASGDWAKNEPSAQVTKATLSLGFDDIDVQGGTANVVDVSTVAAGAPHIIVRLLGDNLHFLAMNTSGSVYLTTVFADKESRSGARFKAVHTRHEFTQVRLTGWTSRPEQYYGECEGIPP